MFTVVVSKETGLEYLESFKHLMKMGSYLYVVCVYNQIYLAKVNLHVLLNMIIVMLAQIFVMSHRNLTYFINILLHGFIYF